MSEVRSSLAVLLVEDNAGDARLIEHYLDAPDVGEFVADATLTHVESLSEGLSELEGSAYDVLFLDLGLSETSGLETLDRVLEAGPEVPIVVLTGLDNREVAVSAIQRGAQDYLPKDGLDSVGLSRALRYAVERHRQEQELKRQNERLERFAGVVSHDLRNPLNVAQMRLESIREEAPTETVETIARNLDRMEQMIDDVLTLAREGKTVESTEPVSLASVARECWASVATDGTTLEVESERTVEADERRLKRLFENLFRNAVDHAATAADDPVTIRVGDLERGFFVEDDGLGIPAEDRDSIFEAGFTTDREGTGFGLNIVQEIAAAHGWTVSVTESDAGGARFEIVDRLGD
jgi:signal transduction histidine kinase